MTYLILLYFILFKLEIFSRDVTPSLCTKGLNVEDHSSTSKASHQIYGKNKLY